jgi:hypothetical protein
MRSVSTAWRAERFGAGAALSVAALVLAGLSPCEARAEEADFGPFTPEYTEFFGKIEGEATLFGEGPRFAGQRRHDLSVAIEPTIRAEWLDGDLEFTFTPFARAAAADDDRSHYDIREAKFDFRSGDWEATVGLDRVFWGKTEANHLVDIINQTDAVEDIDDEDNLGQPMVRVSRLTEIGEFSVFYLPYVRTRTFPGREGRLRSELVVDEDARVIERDGGRWAPSFAARFAGVFGGADIGLSAFNGVARDPTLRPGGFVATPGGPAPTRLVPVYETITQFGFDGQYTSGATLWKAEAIWRDGQEDLRGRERAFVGATGGLEHTLFGVGEGTGFLENADLGLIAEYSIDSRGRNATTIFQNDVILGARLALNDIADTSFLLTSAIDHEFGAATIRLEAETRVTDGWIASLEGVLFVNSGDDPLASDLRDDSFIRMKLAYFW